MINYALQITKRNFKNRMFAVRNVRIRVVSFWRSAREPYLLVSIIFSFLLQSTITCRVCYAAVPKRPRSAKRDFAGRAS